MKGGNCVLKKITSKTFDFSKEFHSREMLESINEKRKSQVIISFSIYSKINMNGFIDWHLWIKNSFSYEVVNKYNRLIDGQNRQAKTIFFNSLYDDEFRKLNVKYFLMLKSKESFQLQMITKIKSLVLIKLILATKVITSKKRNNNSRSK